MASLLAHGSEAKLVVAPPRDRTISALAALCTTERGGGGGQGSPSRRRAQSTTRYPHQPLHDATAAPSQADLR